MIHQGFRHQVPCHQHHYWTSGPSRFDLCKKRSKQSDDCECCGDRTPIVIIGVLGFIGACILLPVLFSCTLPEAETMRNTHAHTCTFFDLETTSTHRCCIHAGSTCSAGCSKPAFLNGGCSAVLEAQIARNMSVGVTRTPCCDGTCCAQSHMECDTCYHQRCYTDQSGAQHCQQVAEECNCRRICDRHSTEQGDIACGTCHDYRVGFAFTLNGVRHDRTHKTTCGLTGRGMEDIACQKATAVAYADDKTMTCYVNHETLEVSWEAPEWNAGCWVGIVLGSLLLLPCALAIPIFLLSELYARGKAVIQRVREVRRASQAGSVESMERHIEELAQRLWEEECHAIDEQHKAFQERESKGLTVLVTLCGVGINGVFELPVLMNDMWEVGEVLEVLPVHCGVERYLCLDGCRLQNESILRDVGVRKNSVLQCCALDLQCCAGGQQGEDANPAMNLAELRKAPKKPTLAEVRQRAEAKLRAAESSPGVKAYPGVTAAPVLHSDVVMSKDVSVTVAKSPVNTETGLSEQAWAVLDDVC